METKAVINDLAVLKTKYKHTQKLLEQVQGQNKGSGQALASTEAHITRKDKRNKSKGGLKAILEAKAIASEKGC